MKSTPTRGIANGFGVTPPTPNAVTDTPAPSDSLAEAFA